VRLFLTYMRTIHPQNRLPSRADFDPLCIPRLLPGIVLVKVERTTPDGILLTSPRFRVLVAGETVLHASPVPMMGRYIDEIAAAIAGGQVVVDVRQRVVETGTTYYWNGRPRMAFRFDFAGLEYCHCPLAADGRTVDHVASFFHYKGINRG
jgi:hypothetical protein